ncbi:TonB-dependent receptor [Pseudoalteromonas ruthenica]|uniref:TonB-dependent receptor n=1 Tax=Pseudoalteromonas ruthenica TaxID=151081 RepID=UPI0011088482|nr:TonB-dependent receptor [Pseudoalteromonas ruthenica]TLX50939.1 TonB-dependent receptor [Pseudoalteromonas ruthenica]
MNVFQFSLVSAAVGAALLSSDASANTSSLQELDKVERISVYGRHNELVLNSGTATKSNMALMQTPAPIVVVDKALLDQQSADTLQEAVRNVSGLAQAGNNYGVGDNLIIRGLGVNYTYDGMYGGADLGNAFNPTRSMTNVDSVEVLKGPATGLYGIGAAGGVINLIEKKPQDQAQYEVAVNVGQWQSYGVMFDATGALSENWAYRAVVNHQSSDGYRDLGSERSEFYGSLRYQASDNHRLLLSTAYIDDEVQVDSVGFPVRIVNWDSIDGDYPLSGADLPNDAASEALQLSAEQRQQLALSINQNDGLEPFDLGDGNVISPLSRPNAGTEQRVKLRWDWYLGANTEVTQQLQFRDYESDFVRQTGAYNYVYWQRRGTINLAPRAPLMVDGELYPYAARRQEYRKQHAQEQMFQYFADLQHTWDWGSVVGEHLLSVNAEKRDISLKSWSIYDADGAAADANAVDYILDIRNPNWPTGHFEDYSPVLRSHYDKSVEAVGISGQEVLYLSDALTARVGVAYTRIKQSYQHRGTARVPEVSLENDSDDAGMTYNLGLNYQLSSQLSTFVNVSKGRTAYSILGSVSENQADNRPDSESESLDIGVRFTALEEDLLGSLVLFDTRRTNLRYANEAFNDNPNDPEFNISVPQYFYDDEDSTKGVEFDLNMALSEVMSVNVNGTYQDAVTVRAGERSGQIKGVPRRFASTWLRYDMSAFELAHPVAVNLGVTYVDERTINSTAFGLPKSVVPSYVRWDAAFAYEADNYKVQLNLDNLFNERYYEKALFLGGLPGEERNLELSVHYQF